MSLSCFANVGARSWTRSLLSIDSFKFACLLESFFNVIYTEDEVFESKARREVDVVDAVAPQTQNIREGSRAVGFNGCIAVLSPSTLIILSFPLAHTNQNSCPETKTIDRL